METTSQSGGREIQWEFGVHNEQLHKLEATRRNSARNRKPLVVGFILSVLVHAVLLSGWGTGSDLDDPGSLAAGPRMGNYRAAEGGGEMLAIAIAAPRPIVVPAPPSNQPLFTEPELVVREPEQFVRTPELSGAAGGAMMISNRGGPGLLNADGGGDGGNNASGRDQRTFPTPRSIIPIWDPPREVKGMRVTVRVLVDARGEPTGEILVEPRIPNSGFDRKLRKELLSMDYVPASSGGMAIAD